MSCHNEFMNYEIRDMIVVSVQEYLSELGTTGTFRSNSPNGRYVQRKIQDEKQILERVDESPEISFRRLSAVRGVGRKTFSTIFHTQQLCNVSIFTLYKFA